MNRWPNAILNLLIRLQMLVIKYLTWNPFIRKTHNPQATQNKLLVHIIRTHKNTSFGRKHGFEAIKNYQHYQKSIPVHRYDDLRPYLEDQDKEKEASNHTERPALFSVTSGTTGKPKYIPLFASTLSQFRKSQKLFSFAQQLGIPEIYQGKILGIGSPVIEGTLESGIPFGSVSGLFMEAIPRLIKCKYAVPREVFEIEDYQLKYFLICAFSLKETNITFISSANPSTFMKIMEVIHNDLERLIHFIATGDPSHWPVRDSLIEARITQSFKPDPKRARILQSFADRETNLTYESLWPNLQAVATWTGGSCKLLIPKLRSLLPGKTKITELGYLSSEFRGSITVDVINNKSIPAFHENFFEFVELDDWDNKTQRFLTLEQIEIGKRYYVVVTTQNGLYRYFINDIIEVTGMCNSTPTIEFIQKGKGITNITGEKLSEQQLIEALDRLKKDLQEPFDFFIMFADPERSQYTLYIEAPPQPALEKKLEEQLSGLNIEFEAKRKSGRLNPTKVVFIKEGAGEEYKKHCLANNQREGQFKVVRLQYIKDCSFNFQPFQIDNP
jgi:hypothetical protein